MYLIDSRGFFVGLIEGSAKGFTPALLSAGLMPLSWVYGLCMRMRRSAYQCRFLRPQTFPVPVISVGNLTVGGTGKTPLVEWLVKYLMRLGRKPAILSRGYGVEKSLRPANGMNDEVLLLKRSLSNIHHYVDSDRLASAAKSLKDGADCLVLDDGFQHLRMHRDVNLLLLDALSLFGNERILPAGPLREPFASLRDASAIILTRVDAVETARLDDLRRWVQTLAPNIPILEAYHRPVALVDDAGTEAEALNSMAGRRVFMFCGIGNPYAFLSTIRQLGAEVVAARFLPDHFAYSDKHLTDLAEAFRSSKAEFALVTEKDMIKIGARWPGPTPLRALRIEFTFCSDLNAVETIVDAALK